MKKLLFLGGLITLILWSTPVLAATNFLFSPSNLAVTSGQTFTVNLAVNPNQIDNYTIKIGLDYPADLLEVKSFSFSNGWTILSQPNYDLVDNKAGRLIKTAGYPGGFSNPSTFGVVSFLSKKSGNALIKLSSNSLALDKNSQNLFSGSLIKTSVTINPPEQTPTKPSLSEKVAVLGITSPEEKSDQKEEIAQKKESLSDISDKLSLQKPDIELPKQASVAKKMPDLTTLLIGFADGILFAVVVFNALRRRKRKKRI